MAHGGAVAPAIDPDWGEAGLTPAEKVYGWNTFEVLAFKTGNPESPVNAIPPPPDGNAAGFLASRTDPDDPWALWAAKAVARTTGEAPVVLPNSGGSICNDVFRDVLGVPTVWIPLSYAGCCQHAPDEHILWPLMRQGMEIIAGLYWDLGDPATGVPKSHQS